MLWRHVPGYFEGKWMICVNSPSGVGPVDLVIESSTGPAQSPPTHPSSSPEILLTLPGHQAGELSLLGAVVDADWSHSIGSAEPLTLALGEAGAAQPPAHQEVLTSKLMIGSMTSTTASASSSSRSAASDVSSSSTSKHIGDSLEESSKLWSWRSQSKSQQIQTNKNSHFSSVSKTSVEVSGFLKIFDWKLIESWVEEYFTLLSSRHLTKTVCGWEATFIAGGSHDSVHWSLCLISRHCSVCTSSCY